MRLIRRTRRAVWYPCWPSRTIWEGCYLAYFWLHIWAGCGSEPVWRRCPETLPKVRAIHGATSGGPNSELKKACQRCYFFWSIQPLHILYCTPRAFFEALHYPIFISYPDNTNLRQQKISSGAYAIFLENWHQGVRPLHWHGMIFSTLWSGQFDWFRTKNNYVRQSIFP